MNAGILNSDATIPSASLGQNYAMARQIALITVMKKTAVSCVRFSPLPFDVMPLS